jgi:hypothetical protein
MPGLRIIWHDNLDPAGGTVLTIEKDGYPITAPDGTSISNKVYPADQLEHARKAVQEAVDDAAIGFDNKPPGGPTV